MPLCPGDCLPVSRSHRRRRGGWHTASSAAVAVASLCRGPLHDLVPPEELVRGLVRLLDPRPDPGKGHVGLHFMRDVRHRGEREPGLAHLRWRDGEGVVPGVRVLVALPGRQVAVLRNEGLRAPLALRRRKLVLLPLRLLVERAIGVVELGAEEACRVQEVRPGQQDVAAVGEVQLVLEDPGLGVVGVLDPLERTLEVNVLRERPGLPLREGRVLEAVAIDPRLIKCHCGLSIRLPLPVRKGDPVVGARR
mmetsp:Transcript_72627/g.122227  ORF Transcript_72627/g.122227 Transcript_72627/m.122227 type:complete len:250 (-) Transcript_72627:133-882(-)